MGMKRTREKKSWYKRAQEYDLGGNITIEKYGRFWKMYLGNEILAVVNYKRGANAIMQVVDKLREKERIEEIDRIEPVNEMMG
jgi:hypothetical protein